MILSSSFGARASVALSRSEPQWDIGPSGARTGCRRGNHETDGCPSQPDRAAGPTARSVIVRFAVGTLAAIAVAVVGGYFVLRSVAIDEAKGQTRTRVKEEAQLVETKVHDGLLRGRAKAVRAVDDVVVGRVLSNSIVRVKIWSAAGRVLYSDDPRRSAASTR